MKKLFKKSISVLLCAVMLITMFAGLDFSAFAVSMVWDGSTASSFESGTGTEEDPYVIKTAEQLALLAKNVNNGNNYQGKYFRLDEDIILNDTTNWEQWGTVNEDGDLLAPVNNWVPIGNREGSSDFIFLGSFDGGGHTISGLYVNQDKSSGLFGVVGDSRATTSVKGITISESYVKGTYSGAIAGKHEYGSCIISDCCNNGNVYGTKNAGGILGYSYSNISVIDCYNNGNVVGEGTTGGVVGYSIGPIKRCYNNGDVIGNTAGGVIGYGYDVTECSNDGDVTGYTTGGIIGYALTCVSDCYNHGTVSGQGSSVGGIIGFGWQVKKIENCYNDGKVSGSSEVGGIIGQLNISETLICIISECYNSGEYDAEYSIGYLGGIAGSISIDETASVTVKDCYNTASITSKATCAGVVGRIVCSYGQAKVIDCYSIGSITYSGNSSKPSVGGIAGYVWGNSEINNCYYLSGCIENSNEYGSSLQSEEMMAKESYVSWNFNKTWEIGVIDGYPYPTLRCFGSRDYTYEVCFFDGDECISRELVEDGEKTTLPLLPNKTDLDFGYWLADSDRFYGNDEYMPTDDVVFRAVWLTRNTSENVWDGSIDIELEGEGTKESPYLISSAEELAGLAQWVNSKGNSYDVYYRQTADILLNDGGNRFSEFIAGKNEWTPIGYDLYTDFYGHYDGNGFIISGLFTRDNDYSGLFGNVSGELKNIRIVNSLIIGSGTYSGGIVGYVGGTVTDCAYHGKVYSSGYYSGGIAGYAGACTISFCESSGTIIGNRAVGGLIGSCYGHNTISGCRNSSSVTGNGPYTGGLVGYANEYLTIYECYNEGSVNGGYEVGGLLGECCDGDCSIKDSYNTGTVSGPCYSAGIAAVIRRKYNSIINCYNVGDIFRKEDRGSGLIGYVTDQVDVSDSYYLKSQAYSYNSYGTSMTSEQMQKMDSFNNWNFNKTWEMDYSSDYSYPTLRCFGSKLYYYEIRFFDGDELAKSSLVKVESGIQLHSMKNKNDLDFAYWISDDVRYYAGDTFIPDNDISFYAVYTTRNSSRNVWDGSADTEWEGSGTKESPYLISSAEELAGLAQWTNEGNKTNNTYFRQTCDIVLNDSGERFAEYIAGKNDWIPIGDYNNYYRFLGIYDGNGHTITGLYITHELYSGLFGYIDNAAVKNLSVRDSYVKGIGKRTDTGGIVAYASHNCNISGCSNCGTVVGLDAYTGGIVGYMDSSDSSLVDCSNSGTIIGRSSSCVGGVAGKAYIAINCSNSGDIICDSSKYVGGIVGEGKAEKCCNSGDIVAEGRNNYDAGGITGYGSAVSCYNTGKVTGNYNSGGISGGGWSYTDCNNIGEVSGYTAGGIVGYTSGGVENSFNCGTISGSNSTGGIAGEGEHISITGCYNTGTLYGKGSFIGGIIGDGEYSVSVVDCYNTGTVFDNGCRYSGGIAGVGQIIRCYNIGTVDPGKHYTYKTSCGGIIGDYEKGAATDCYYLDSCATKGNTIGTMLTDEQMKAAESYTGFDFENTWEFGAVGGYYYPTLKGTTHIITHTVTFVDSDGTKLKEQVVPHGESATPPEIIGAGNGIYYRELDHWDKEYTYVTENITVKAVYKQVAIIKFTDITVPFIVKHGFSREELRVQLEAYLSRKLCTTTNGYKMRCDIAWNEDDLDAYDPERDSQEPVVYTIRGVLKITDPAYSYLSSYYDMEEGAGVRVLVTVMPKESGIEEFTEDDLRFEILDDGVSVKITGYTGNAAEVVLPDSINGYAVTAVSDNAFAGCESLTAVYIPSSIKSIGDSAFSGCSSLLMVSFADGVETIGARAFYDTSLICATIPQSVSGIGEYAFGYYGEDAAIEGFEIYGYPDSAAEAYAGANGFELGSLSSQYDDASGIYAVVEDSVTLMVDKVDEGSYYDTAQQIVLENDDVALFEIKTVDDNENEVQPGNVLTLSIPVPEGFDAQLCRVYRINSDGSVKAMNAKLINGKLVFNTPHLSYYAVVEEIVEPPTAETITPDSVLLEQKSGYEYRCGDGEWQASPLFEGLTPDTDYTFYARLAAADDAPASAQSEGAVIRTAPREKFSLSGAVGTQDEGTAVTLILMHDGKEICTVTTKDGTYTFENIENGSYTLTASAENHIARSYDIVIFNADAIQDIELEKVAVKTLLGDVDGDGEVTIIDATYIQRRLAGLPNEVFKQELADVDEDGEITIFDATDIQRWLAGIPTTAKNIGKPV